MSEYIEDSAWDQTPQHLRKQIVEVMNELLQPDGRPTELWFRLWKATHPPEAAYLGNGKLIVGDESIVLTPVQAEVLEGLLEAGGAACDKHELRKLSGVPYAERRLGEIVRRHARLLNGCIMLPGARGKGGYRTTIVRLPE